LEEVLRKDEASGAYVLTAGKAVPNSADIVGSDHMKRLLDALSTSYDLVIIDSPPVLAVVDARVFSNIVDATIFAVRWADTRREMVGQGIKHVVSSGGRLAGAALTMVDVKKHAQYGYGDSSYYYGRIKKYYVD